MKNLFYSLAFMLIGVTAFANEKNIEVRNDIVVSECCSVTVHHESTGDSITVRSCRTTAKDACDAAYAKASSQIE